jgi:hypothetical protein
MKKFLLAFLVLTLFSLSALGEEKEDNTKQCQVIARNCVLAVESLSTSHTPPTEIMRIMLYCAEVYKDKQCPEISKK